MRLIDVDEAKRKLIERARRESSSIGAGVLLANAEMLDSFPTIEAEPVRHGRWVHTDKALSWHGKDECGECGYHTADRLDLSYFNFCPNCGAKMDKGEE